MRVTLSTLNIDDIHSSALQTSVGAHLGVELHIFIKSYLGARLGTELRFYSASLRVARERPFTVSYV